MKQAILLGVILACVATLMGAIYWKAERADVREIDGKPVVKIGAILPLSGNLATQVPTILDAAQLALKDAVPLDSKYTYQLIAEDYAGSPARAVVTTIN